MLRSGICHDPDSTLRLERRKVCDDLAEMVVIALRKLILDYYGATGVILGHQIDIQISGGFLPFRINQGEVENLIQNVYVFFQPSGEIERFVLPHLPERNPADLPDQWETSSRTSIFPVTAAEMRAVRYSLSRSMASLTFAMSTSILAVSWSRKAAMTTCSSLGGNQRSIRANAEGAIAG